MHEDGKQPMFKARPVIDGLVLLQVQFSDSLRAQIHATWIDIHGGIRMSGDEQLSQAGTIYMAESVNRSVKCAEINAHSPRRKSDFCGYRKRLNMSSK